MINVLEDAAREAGKVLLSFYQKELVVKSKASHHSVVTEADIASQNIVRESLLAGALKAGLTESQIGFIGEEEGMNTQASHTFIIDPLDGTNNFSSGLDIFGVTIALAQDQEITHGVLYFPTRDELFIAEKGKGTFLVTKNDRIQLQMKPQQLSSSLYGGNMSSRAENRERIMQAMQKVYPLFKERRILGACIYEVSLLLTNVFGAIVSNGPRLWDIAAGKLMIEEAGGSITAMDGGAFALNFEEPDTPHEFVACHPDNLDAILKALRS